MFVFVVRLDDDVWIKKINQTLQTGESRLYGSTEECRELVMIEGR